MVNEGKCTSPMDSMGLQCLGVSVTQRSEWLSWDWQTSRLRLWFGAEICFFDFLGAFLGAKIIGSNIPFLVGIYLDVPGS